MKVEVPEIAQLEKKLDLLLSRELETMPNQEWFSLKQAWALKGACAWNSFRQRRWLHPLGGHVEGYIGGVGCFRRATIIEWLSVTDQGLADYHKLHQTGVQVPAVREVSECA